MTRKSPSYEVELAGVERGDTLLCPVSVGKEYFWGQHLEATLIAAADNKLEVPSVTFLVAGALQRHTHMMKRVPRMLALMDSVTKKLSSDDPTWVDDIKFSPLFEENKKAGDLIITAGQACYEEADERHWKKVLVRELQTICREKATKTGESWISHVENRLDRLRGQRSLDRPQIFYKRYGKKNQKLLHFRWDVMTAKASFPEKKRQVEQAYAENAHQLRDIIDEAANAFVDDFIHRERDEPAKGKNKHNRHDFPANDDSSFVEVRRLCFMLCKAYIMEESAVIMILIEEDAANAMMYPFEHNTTNNKLYKCIQTLCELVRDKQKDAEASDQLMKPVSTVFRELRDDLEPPYIRSPPTVAPAAAAVLANGVKVEAVEDAHLPATNGSMPVPLALRNGLSSSGPLGMSPERRDAFLAFLAETQMKLLAAGEMDPQQMHAMHMLFLQFGNRYLQWDARKREEEAAASGSDEESTSGTGYVVDHDMDELQFELDAVSTYNDEGADVDLGRSPARVVPSHSSGLRKRGETYPHAEAPKLGQLAAEAAFFRRRSGSFPTAPESKAGLKRMKAAHTEVNLSPSLPQDALPNKKKSSLAAVPASSPVRLMNGGSVDHSADVGAGLTPDSDRASLSFGAERK